MKKILKKIFRKEDKTQTERVDPPGRTFKRILTSEYFHHTDKNADDAMQHSSKACKIAQINEHELLPMYVRFVYEGDSPISAHVAFQKEVFAKKWNMIHITEVSFTVNASDFSEFETMANVTLTDDFRDVTPQTGEAYTGIERRKKKRS